MLAEFGILISGLLVPEPPTTQADVLASLVESIRTVERDADHTSTHVELFHLKPQSWSPDVDIVWNAEQWFERFNVQWHRVGRKWRIDLEAVTKQPEGEVAPLKISSFWTGAFWLQRDDLNRALSIAKKPPANPEIDCLALFDAFAGHTFVGGLPLSEVLQRMKIAALERNEDRVVVRGGLHEGHTIVITLRLVPQPVIEAVHLTVLTSQLPGRDPRLAPPNQVMYRVLEWAPVDDGRLMPMVAVRDTIHHQPSRDAAKPGEVFMTARTIIRRLKPDRTGLQIDPVIQDGDFVDDERLGIKYTHGARELMIDGRMVRVRSPVTIESTQDLPSLLARAEGAASLPSSQPSETQRGN